jgi:hypothetical protein
MQRLLSAAVWDEAGVRDDLRGYVLEHFADPGAPRTRKSRSTWLMPPAPGPRSSTGPFTCRNRGQVIRPGAGPPACPKPRCSPPSPRWPRR